MSRDNDLPQFEMPPFGPEQLLECYAHGVFPMAETRENDAIFIVDPDERGILPLDGLIIRKSLAKTVRSGRFEIKTDTVFMDVVRACAAPRPGHPDTWINKTILNLYEEIYDLGFAHSVECWQDGALVGGLYGVNLAGGFFGESMFSKTSNASKVALVHLIARLNAGGYTLLDTQFVTNHLRSLGAIEISRTDYHKHLDIALKAKASFYPKNYCDLDFRSLVKPSSAFSRGGT
ncbi:MAG: leucyl/phenylalanyl-tRNA--protein transferase [Robiginitomaculum sp.]